MTIPQACPNMTLAVEQDKKMPTLTFNPPLESIIDDGPKVHHFKLSDDVSPTGPCL